MTIQTDIGKFYLIKILHNYPFSGNTIRKTKKKVDGVMKRNRMRRLIQQKQYAIASFELFAAIAAMTGVYVSNRITNERQEQELVRKEQELADAAGQEEEKTSVPDYSSDPFVNATNPEDQEEDLTSVSSIIKPKETEQDKQKKEQDMQTDTDDREQDQKNAADGKTAEPEKVRTEPEQKSAQDTQAHSKSAVALNFSPESDLSWPLQGDVILNYSMDQTVYFATLEQYKYNPALIIAGKVNDPVNAAATGKITDISANEETGLTVTMDLGNGYSAVYGQLKEVLYKEGATVEVGNAIGYVAEPTKYYSVEGSNLYFELLKGEEPVDPMQYMQ